MLRKGDNFQVNAIARGVRNYEIMNVPQFDTSFFILDQKPNLNMADRELHRVHLMYT